ncbi:aspartate aminotransferase family protein [Halobacteriales archaeon SW_7_68_16]|nr:MAG: aspartate aminotransferase family protein [Halobacteriales archaeon SW_7_68_16]
MDRHTAEPSVEQMPGERAREWAAHHRDVAATSTYVYDFVWDLAEEAHGPFCTDIDGNVLLDFTSHVAAAPLGYDNDKIEEKLAAFDLHDPMKIAGQDFYAADGWPPEDPDVPGPAQLMDRLTEINEYGLDTVFLSNSGAEAVENAIKICYDASGGSKYAITFEGAFHGRTLGTLSLNRSKEVYRRSFPEIDGVHDVPYCRDSGCTAATCGCGFFPGTDEAATSTLRSMLDPDRGFVTADDVSYVIIEPVQGEGGYKIPSDAFVDELTAVCERHDLPLIVDEIQSGMGRTGEWWASDHFPFEPDVITSAKALRVGATIASEDTFPDERGRISSTWGAGDLLASLQGCLTIDTIHEYGLLDNATERGRQAVDHLADLDLPGVEDVRGLGLMLAIEFDEKKRRDAVVEAALERGLLTLGCGYRTLRLLPPLDVTEREIRMGVELLAEAVEDVAVEAPPADD